MSLTGNLVVKTGIRAISLDYRLAPENPFPARIDDGLSAYRDLLEQGVNPASIGFAGDSAGGGLCITICLKARDAGLPLLSPATRADLMGFPPLLLQVGTNEPADSTRLAERARAMGVDVILDVTTDVPHVFQGLAGLLDEADQALDRAALFLTQHVAG